MHRLLRTLTSFLEGGASLTGMGKGESEGEELECMQTNVDKFWCEGCRDSWRGTRVKGFFVFCPSIKYAGVTMRKGEVLRSVLEFQLFNRPGSLTA